jgi:glycosyltransferase involved in cell wall biosynthesis
MLLIAETHPVPYHAPVYRHAASRLGVPLKVLYGSDFSAHGYFDQEFQVRLSWDSDLFSGYDHHFLSRVSAGGGRHYDDVGTSGLWKKSDELQPKAIMTLGYFHAFDFSAIRYARSRQLPLIFRGETSDRAQRRSAIRELARDTILRRLYQHCSSLLFLGEESREHYLRLGSDPSRLVFSPYCVDHESFSATEADRISHRAETRRLLSIPEDAFVVVFSGKLTLRKGVELLPQAIRRLPLELRKRCVLLFLGDGEMRQEILTLSGVEPRVQTRFAGFQNQSQLSSYYHAGDVLALPSRQKETWGLVVNEALNHGLPVVVSDMVGCHQDLVVPGVTGAVARPDDVESLAACISKVAMLANNPATRKLCREHVERYSVHAAALGIADAWSRLAL